MSQLKLNGDVSGYVILKSNITAANNTLTLPNVTDTLLASTNPVMTNATINGGTINSPIISNPTLTGSGVLSGSLTGGQLFNTTITNPVFVGNLVLASLVLTTVNPPVVTGIYLTASNTMAFSTNYTERMRIAPGGNILINDSAVPLSGNATVVVQGIGTNGGGIEISGGASGGTLEQGLNGGGMTWSTYSGAVGSESYSERVRLTSSGNLLINTNTAPSGSFISMVVNGASNTGGIELVGSTGGGWMTSNNTGGLSFGSYTGAVGSETYQTRMRLQNAGNLLIGASISAVSGNATVVVQGVGSNGGGIELSGGGAGGILQQALNGGGVTWSTYTGAVGSETYVENMRMDSSGRVLIGSTGYSISSTEKLEVNSGTGGQAAFLSSSDTAATVYIQNQSSTASTNQPYVFLYDSSTITRGGLGINYTASNMWLSGQSGIAFRYGGSTGLGNSEAMRVDANGRLLVGTATAYVIGPTVATNQAQIISNAGAYPSPFGMLRYNGVGASGAIMALAGTNAATLGTYSAANTGAALATITLGGDTGSSYGGVGGQIVGYADGPWTGSSTPGVISFQTTTTNSLNSTERMRIDSNGNVLIGTSTAASDKAIAVVINSTGNPGAGGGGIQFTNSNFGGGAIQATLGGGLQLWVFSGAVGSETYSEPLRLNGNGNVFIGTAFSAGANTINSTATLLVNSTYGGGIELINNNSGGGNISALTLGGMAFSTFTGAPGAEVITERLRISGSGNVLIGATATPAGGNVTLAVQGAGTNAGGIELSGGSAGGGNISGINGGGLVFGSYVGTVGTETYTERMRMTSTGSIGIGTAAVNYQLDVYGNLHLGNTTTVSGIVFSDGTFQRTAASGGGGSPSYGAPGTVQFAGAGNTYSGNTSSFFWDNGNIRLGVGTTAPLTTLQVGGNMNANNFTTDPSGVIQSMNKTISTVYTIPTNQNAFSVGNIQLSPGANVTVQPGTRWVII